MAHLLLVDDDDVLRRILVLLLRQTGHTVVDAADGAGALACLAAAAGAFDLLILDLMMPDMDGYELTRRVRAQPAACTAPIILFTASLSGPDPTRALAAGADAYMIKTTNAGRLNAQIEAVLAAARPGGLEHA